MYPSVLSEDRTLDLALQGQSLARYGDGELRLCLEGNAKAQRHVDPKLRIELREILANPITGLLPCIPNLDPRSPNIRAWGLYAVPRYVSLYKQKVYGSAFITRPDSAPWIDHPGYWERVKQLWRGKAVTLVRGDEKSLTPKMLEADGATVRVVDGPSTEAYAVIDRIERDVGTPDGSVLICLGPTATVLAARLARKGIHALDLGHIGMFMRRLDVKSEIVLDDIVSPQYKATLEKRYTQPGWGGSGYSHAPEIRAFANELGAKTILDYGCGRGTLKPVLPEYDVREYDPGIKGKDVLPEPADLVVATDVLEHIEKDRLDAVLSHLRRLAVRGLFLTIATKLAREILPDGRNAHLIVQPSEWWLSYLKKFALVPYRAEKRKSYTVWIKRT